MPAYRLLLTALGIALLSGCNDSGPAAGEAARSGTVLEGTVSDAMLPLDSVQSEPPLEDPEAAATVAADNPAEVARPRQGRTTEAEPDTASDLDAAQPEAPPQAEGVEN